MVRLLTCPLVYAVADADHLWCVACADMKKQFVYDPLISKRQQYLLATQVSVLPSPSVCPLPSVTLTLILLLLHHQLVRAVLKIGKLSLISSPSRDCSDFDLRRRRYHRRGGRRVVLAMDVHCIREYDRYNSH